MTAAMGEQNKQGVSQRLKVTTGNAKTILLCVVSEHLADFWFWGWVICFVWLFFTSNYLIRYFLN